MPGADTPVIVRRNVGAGGGRTGWYPPRTGATLLQMTETVLRNGADAVEERGDRWITVEEQAIADLLVSPTTYRYLTPFLRTARTLAEAADRVGVRPTALHYHVRRFLRAGLLEEVDTVPTRGRPGRRYRAPAQNFFIPLASTSIETIEAALYRIQEPLLRETIRQRVREAARFSHALGLGLTLTEEGSDIYLMPEGDSSWHDLERFTLDDFPVLFSKFMDIPLDPSEAKTLQRELIALYLRTWTRAVGKSGSRRYLVHLAIVPREQ